MARHYDELDGFYRALWGEDLHHGLWLRGDEKPDEATENLTRRVAERAEVGPGDRVCDVGCGYGGPARFLSATMGAHVVGLTLSEAQHREAIERAGEDPRLRFLLRDWMDNDLPDEAFDAVIAIESGSHMPVQSTFVRECGRVVRSGGRVVIAAWLSAEEPEQWQVRRLLAPICSEGRLSGLPTRSEYEGWIEEVGLRLLRFEDLSDQVRRTWAVCARRVGARLLRDPKARRYLLDAARTERRFVLTVGRMWLAYRVGALRYGLFTATRN